MGKPFVAVLMGSDSDLATVQSTLDTLSKLEVSWEVKITSAHRTPAATHAYVKDADERGCAVFVAAAGLAAHLAGTVAALTLKPVIGIPMDGGP
ncbi:MAG: AIR carboxylase family protein, partial [Arenicellales bacterium WSBS_2016_MAG_OTU3]